MRKWQTELRALIGIRLKMGYTITEDIFKDFVEEWQGNDVKAVEIWQYINELKAIYKW